MIALLSLVNIGWGEWLVIFFVALLVFGPKRLPELARNLGRTLHQFRHGFREVKENLEKLPEEPKKNL